MEGLECADLASTLDRLADRDERGHVWILRPEGSRDDRADVRHRHRLGRNITCVPVILMARMQNEAQVRGVEGTNDRATIDHPANLLEPLGELDVIDGRVD